MQIYGYFKASAADEPALLDEVTLVASPSTLRRLAAFLGHVADQMDRHGAAFGHEHFADYAREMSTAPQIIAMRESDGD